LQSAWDFNPHETSTGTMDTHNSKQTDNINTDSHGYSPMVSVIMVAYNADRYIREAIEGVVRQKRTFSIELIVLDDCSTDDTREIVMQMDQKYPGVINYVRNEKNLGSQGNYLKGFRMARGRYMALCDADDYWHCRSKLKRQVEYMESHPECALTFHRVVNYYESTGEKTLSNGSGPSEYSVESLSRSNYITNLSVMYRRELVDMDRLPAWIMNHRSPDYAIHMLYAAQGTIHYFPRPMGVYRKVEGAIWSTAGAYRRLKMSLDMRISLIKEFENRAVITAGLRDASKSIVRAMLECAIDPADRQEACEYARTFGLDPSVDPANGKMPAPQRRSMISRAVRFISRYVPRPRP